MRNGSEKALDAQRRYSRVSKLDADPGLVVPEAFVRGIRHIGYRSNVEAIAELVDNSIQAYAQRVDLVSGFAEAGQGALTGWTDQTPRRSMRRHLAGRGPGTPQRPFLL